MSGTPVIYPQRVIQSQDKVSDSLKVKKSQTCINTKIAVVAVVAAVAIIAFTSGVFMIMAQQGVNIPGINSIANMIQSQVLWGATGAAGGILIIDLVIIIYMIRSQMNPSKIITVDEFVKKQVGPRMSNMTYWPITVKAVKPSEKSPEGEPGIYTLLVKDANGKVNKRDYKTEEERNTAIQNLGKDYTDAKQAFKTSETYPYEYIFERMSKKQQNEMLMNAHMVLPGNYTKYWFQIPQLEEVKDVGIRVLIVNNAGKKEFYFCKRDKEQAVEARLTEFFDQDSVNKIEEVFLRWNIKLQDKQYWPYEIKIEGKQFFVVAYKKPDNEKISFNISKEAKKRNEFIATLNDWTSGYLCTENEVQQLIPDDQMDILKKRSVNAKEFYTHEFYTDKLTSGIITVLKYRSETDAESKTLYFKIPIARQRFIVTHCGTFYDLTSIETQLLGRDFTAGIVQKEKLDLFCKEKQYWPCEAVSDGKPVFAIIYKQKSTDSFTYKWWKTAQERQQALITGDFSAQNGYERAYKDTITNLNTQVETEKDVNQKPVGSGNPYQEEVVKAANKNQIASSISDSQVETEKDVNQKPVGSGQRYEKDDVEKMLKSEAIDFVSKQLEMLKSKKQSAILTYDIPTIDGKAQVFTVVYYSKNNKKNVAFAEAVYFSTERARAVYINDKCNGMTAKDWIEFQKYIMHGVPELGITGYIVNYRLDILLSQPKDTFIVELKGPDGKKHYVFLTRFDSGDIRTTMFEKKNVRDKKIDFIDRTKYVKSFDIIKLNQAVEKVITDRLLHYILVAPQQYWMEETTIDDKQVTLLFYLEDKSTPKKVVDHKLLFSESKQAEEVITKLGLTSAKKAIDDAEEYPPKLGDHLASLVSFSSQRLTALLENKLMNNEYWICGENAKTQIASYPTVSLLLTRPNTGGYVIRHYFKTDEQRMAYQKNKLPQHYKNGYTRHISNEKYMTFGAAAYCAKHQETKPLFMVIDNPHSKRAQILTWKPAANADGKPDVENFYVASDKVPDIRSRFKEYKEITQTDLAEVELSAAEEDFLKQEAQTNEQQWKDQLTKLRYSLCYYTNELYAVFHYTIDGNTQTLYGKTSNLKFCETIEKLMAQSLSNAAEEVKSNT